MYLFLEKEVEVTILFHIIKQVKIGRDFKSALRIHSSCKLSKNR